MWREGDRVRDERTGKAGTVVRVTGPAPFLYRVLVDAGDEGPPLMLYRYGEQLRRVAGRSPGGPSPVP